MSQKVYISNGYLSLSEYVKDIDDIDCYNCWRNPETQKGYNHRVTAAFDEFRNGGIKSRFKATITRCADRARVGLIFVSPENTLPDLAIMIYQPYRRLGYGTAAFELGVQYCFDQLKLDKIFAGSYEDNSLSLKMLKSCGFIPHPEGNQNEKHYLTGQDIVQLDFVKYNPDR
ncbi:GNAT family N-acetyltransferase [Oscillospiraceae bacterium HV4-5-C5C]|nr:GNAT family N-acetyltransferase [Oscillospiraceae bacterium HV4-5-C5C]